MAPRAAAGFGALLGAAAAALLVGCAATPGGGAPSGGPAALAGRLPAVAAGFRRGEARAVGTAGEGREVSYATEAGRSTAAATVELLAENTAPAAALEAALAEAQRAGPAREVRDVGRFSVAPAGASTAPAPLLCAQTAGRYGRERVAGLVCAGRAGASLVRLRVAMPAREPPPADPRAFAEAIAAGLAAAAGVTPGA